MDRHRFPRESRRTPPISLGRARERDITGTVNRTRRQRCTRAAQRQGVPGEVDAPGVAQPRGTRAQARLRSGLRHRSAVARERLALAQGVAASHGCEAGWDVHVDSLKSVAALSRNAAHQRLICQCHTRESADCCGISLRSSHKQARFARVCAPGPQRKLLEQCCNSRQKLRGALRILDGAYQAREGAQLQQVR